MPNLSYSKTGYSFCRSTTDQLTSSYVAFPVTKDATNSPQSSEFPNSCNIQSVELYLTRVSAVGLSVQLFLARDSGGLIPITPAEPSGATQAITYTDTSVPRKGGVAFVIDADYHYDSGVTNATTGTMYVVAKLTSANTASVDIRVNWRA